MSAEPVSEWVNKAEDNFVSAVRYPGLEATANDARDAVKAMKKIRKFARARLGLRSA
jgi:hypothetical protein